MSAAWAIKAARLYDGRAVHEGVALVVRDGTVVEPTPDVPVTDLGEDITILPGLVDAHVHLSFNAQPDVVSGFEVDDDELLGRMQQAAAQTVDAGVTTVRDLGDRSFLATKVTGPLTVLAAGPPLTIPKGHCWFLGGEVADRAEMLVSVRERAEAGCAVVKVMVSGGNITPNSPPPWEPQFAVDDLVAVVDEAHRLGLKAAGHVHGTSSIVAALDAGFDTLEHVTFMSPDGVDEAPEVRRRIVDSGVVVSATAGALPGNQPPPAVAARMERVLELMTGLHRDGARVVIGTDAGIGPGKPHGVMPHALRMMCEAGVPADEALRMMTSGPADALGLPGKGRLQPGADADLIAVRGDPRRDPDALLDVVGVWVSGTRVR